MEKRNVTLSLEDARKFYNSDNEALKEVALQAFTEQELIFPHYTEIKTFEDACDVLGLNKKKVELDIDSLKGKEFALGTHLVAIYKLHIIRKALNGNWESELGIGTTYYPYLLVEEASKLPTTQPFYIGTICANRKKYHVFGSCGDNNRGLLTKESNFSYFSPSARICNNANYGLFACKNYEIARYFGFKFGKLIFDACYAQYVGLYEWITE